MYSPVNFLVTSRFDMKKYFAFEMRDTFSVKNLKYRKKIINKIGINTRKINKYWDFQVTQIND